MHQILEQPANNDCCGTEKKLILGFGSNFCSILSASVEGKLCVSALDQCMRMEEKKKLTEAAPINISSWKWAEKFVIERVAGEVRYASRFALGWTDSFR